MTSITYARMFEYKQVQAPSILDSGGCGPCIAVGAVYKNLGFMAHYPSRYYTPLEEMLLELKREFSDSSLLGIYIGGGGIDSYFTKAEKKLILQNRSQTLQKIRQAGFASHLQQIKWGRGNSTTGLQLLLSEKRVVFVEEYDESPHKRITEDSLAARE